MILKQEESYVATLPFYAVLKFDETGQNVVECLERIRPPRVPFTEKQDKRLMIPEEAKITSYSPMRLGEYDVDVLI